MRHRYPNLALLCMVIATSLVLAAPLTARPDEAKKQDVKQLRVEGSIVLISKDASKITIQQGGNVRRTILYDEQTRFSFRNKSSSIYMLKEGVRVICLGKENDKKEFLATRIEIRTEK